MRITFQQVQKNISDLANRERYNVDFIYELLAAYGRSASSITKLQTGLTNLAKDKDNEILQRNVVYFKHNPDGKILPAIEKLKQDPLVVRYNPRYLIVTDFNKLAAIDNKKSTTLDIKIQDIDRHIDFFYGWTGDETTDEKTEAVADRRAAEKMTELYDELANVNKDNLLAKNSNFRHELNVFFSRLLFCYFAEDTKVFSKNDENIFTSAIKDYTQTDGSDTDLFLTTLFEAFDQKDKSTYTSPFSKFPYVNGGLFSKERKIVVPKFNPQARKILIECGSLKWDEINPDIFGSMFQGVVDEQYRSDHGMHYTSVPNIMKTIEPLFLDELREEFDKSYDNSRKLITLYDRISKIKIFDPACGSGNFLIIAYKELRKLEHSIIERLMEGKLNLKLMTQIRLDNFYGIEIDDFACEIATLSLHIAKHQMDIEFEKQFGKEIELIPLIEKANIVHANAARIDWNDVCPNIPHAKEVSVYEQRKLLEDEYTQEKLIGDEEKSNVDWDEIYLIGNPPYQGAKLQDINQKKDFEYLFVKTPYSKNLDYISIWFIKGARYISNSLARLAFVSTNSICQGEHIGNLWPHIYSNNVEIGFAYNSFKWTNNARGKAGVTCVIVSLRNINEDGKYLFIDGIKHNVKNINAYLIAGDNILIVKRSNSISGLPEMCYGNMPLEGGFLKLNEEDKKNILDERAESGKYIRPLIGGDGLINGINRWCLWIEDSDLKDALLNSEIKKRIDQVKEFRMNAGEVARTLVNRPHQFRYRKQPKYNSIVVPRTTSDRRLHLPCAIFDKNYIIDESAQVIYDGELFVLGIIMSYMHMVWIKTIAGRLEKDIRYSTEIVYNNFPVPQLTQSDKNELTIRSKNVLFTRENHSEKTLAEMYDPDKMPDDLKQAHYELDVAVDRLYRNKPYGTDEERLADLVSLYEKMIKEEQERNNV